MRKSSSKKVSDPQIHEKNLRIDKIYFQFMWKKIKPTPFGSWKNSIKNLLDLLQSKINFWLTAQTPPYHVRRELYKTVAARFHSLVLKEFPVHGK